ncbi:PilZ domain-containing protein [Thiomicrospira sp. ALE5]|uniref:PilZ domain-containing protein n=1 Tax=Thiomicrospira sp. ALE5 TaxID=748650 RepID=UPI0008DFC0E3|nr:PilZ domain-containing protein [Thiomicrospira sp. ALE5]SFR53624.1 PilZ domain-containing protein [Thiomicrospira sp. ALE5]
MTPKSPITDRDILATGANYIPTSVQTHIHQQKTRVNISLNQLSENSDLVKKIFAEIQEHLDFFEHCLVELTKGYNAKKDPNTIFKLNAYFEGMTLIKTIKESAPKTYTYIKLIETKYLYFLQRLDEVMSQSSSDTFYSPEPLPMGFKIDELCEKINAPKFENIPLMQAILHTSVLLNIYTDIFRQLHEDHIQRQHPEDWRFDTVNVSASGVALNLKKGLRVGEALDVLIYFKDEDKLLNFDGTVVSIQSQTETFYERVAINLEFFNGINHTFLLAQIQKYELQECFN